MTRSELLEEIAEKGRLMRKLQKGFGLQPNYAKFIEMAGKQEKLELEFDELLKSINELDS